MGFTRSDWEPALGKFFYPALNGTWAVYGNPAPGAPTLALVSGGTLALTPMTYRIVGLDGKGSSLPSPESSPITPTSGNQTVAVTWNLSPEAAQYQVYGRTSGAELLIATVAASAYTIGGTQTYNDTGAITPAGALPTVATASVDKRIVYDIFLNNSSGAAINAKIFENGAQIGSVIVPTMFQGRWGTAGGSGGVAVASLSVSTSAAMDVGVTTNE